MRGNQGIYVFSFWLHVSIVVFCLGRQGQSSRPSLSKNHKQTLPPVTTNAKTLPSTAIPTITTATPCLPNQFQCSDGSCIRKTWRCDGSLDCLDHSDEEKCPCKSSQMTCANGVCVNKLWICDGADDCGDNSDEQNCNAPTAPSGKVLGCLCRDIFFDFLLLFVLIQNRNNKTKHL
ncbi:unnamed protein product [Pocillopora meandrina]|uniref:Uncharacterized protein n=1 Tax=Pocillopora meandrina TaxID=46732 RepID=A0AAU9Y5F3_9CNID|nr:unnamed protein product [Pocillopora meandrina]